MQTLTSSRSMDVLVADQLGDLVLVLQIDPRLQAGASVAGQGHRTIGSVFEDALRQMLARADDPHSPTGAVGAGRDCLCLAQEVIVDRQGGTHQRIITSSLHIMMRIALTLASNTNPRAVRPVGRRRRPGGCAPW